MINDYEQLLPFGFAMNKKTTFKNKNNVLNRLIHFINSINIDIIRH